jgi:hypothetical protein
MFSIGTHDLFLVMRVFFERRYDLFGGKGSLTGVFVNAVSEHSVPI